ncbi:MAG: MmgE/PrpD family protein [Burkholderiaceae bacterium]
MDATTLTLAELVTAIDIGSLPAVAVHEAKRRLLDSIACAMGAFDEPFCAEIRGVAQRYQGSPSARIWGTGARSSMEMAGFANATMVRYQDLSDTVLSRAAGHPSDMIPALVALAEGTRASGAALLEAIVAAYELYVGLCDATAFQKRAVDQSTAAALGAAGGAARLLQLNVEQTGNAISLALGANVNLYNVRSGALSDWKACAGPNAAKQGVFAALLAADGVSGPTAVFDGTAGFCDIVGPLSFALNPTTAPRILGTHLKAYPVCFHGQSAVDAATSLTGRVAPGDISSVSIETYEAAHRAMANDPSRWTPENRETADHSLPYTVGVVLTRGRLVSADYEPDALADPALGRFMQRISVVASDAFTADYPTTTRTRIRITTTDGQTHESETAHPKGHALNPLSDVELTAKLNGLLPAAFTGERGERIRAGVWALDDARSVDAMVDALCP